MSLNLQRIAWAVMLGAFFTFCGVCAFTIYGTYSFLFQSTVPMTVLAQASRGSIGITGTDLREDVERGSRSLALGNLVRPNAEDSQGVILVQDPYRDNAFVASLTLIGDSTASLRTALRPRFNWSNPFNQGSADYLIEATRIRGVFEVTLADDLPLDLALELLTDRRVRIRMTEPGWYSIDARGDTVRVTSHGGTALIYGPDSSVGYSVTGGSGSIYSIDTDVIRARPQVLNLLQNSQLAPQPGSDGTLLGTVPVSWVCRSDQDIDIAQRGSYVVGHQDGRRILQLTRGGGALSSGESGCSQGVEIGDVWQDVSNYNWISLHASFYLKFQSLPVCGFEGSECPLMLRLDYLVEGDEPGVLVKRELLYGFYGVPGPADPYDQTCPTCGQLHTRLQENAWYSFDSGNILNGLEQPPVAISRVRFYASGHEYDVRISRIELIAENTSG